MSISNEQLNTIEKYDEEKRLSYLLQQVVSNQEIWILADEHGCIMLNTEDEDCVTKNFRNAGQPTSGNIARLRLSH